MAKINTSPSDGMLDKIGLSAQKPSGNNMKDMKKKKKNNNPNASKLMQIMGK